MVLGEAEEPVPFLRPLEFARGVDGALAVDDFVFALEQFTANAVPAVV